jgi:hypothetical protein
MLEAIVEFVFRAVFEVVFYTTGHSLIWLVRALTGFRWGGPGAGTSRHYNVAVGVGAMFWLIAVLVAALATR